MAAKTGNRRISKIRRNSTFTTSLAMNTVPRSIGAIMSAPMHPASRSTTRVRPIASEDEKMIAVHSSPGASLRVSVGLKLSAN